MQSYSIRIYKFNTPHVETSRQRAYACVWVFLILLDDQRPAAVPDECIDPAPRILEPLVEALTITDDSTVELRCRISNVGPDDVTWSKNDRMARKGSRFKVETGIICI